MNNIRVSRTVLRLHGSFLILLTGFLITVSLIGTFRAVGVMAILSTYPLVEVGLFQAYALMMLAAIVMWIGSFQDDPGKWHVVGLLAHLSPLLANFIFSDLLVSSGLPGTTPPGTIPLHGSLMLLELTALVYYYSSKTGVIRKTA
ncbi:MAG TPA: hypothetical protein VK249_08615 [Anaerolineales bacterium]|nr:hypothetical protein [Anaerolineales bacterium]